MDDKMLRVLIFGPIVCLILVAVSAWLDHRDVYKSGRR